MRPSKYCYNRQDVLNAQLRVCIPHCVPSIHKNKKQKQKFLPYPSQIYSSAQTTDIVGPENSVKPDFQFHLEPLLFSALLKQPVIQKLVNQNRSFPKPQILKKLKQVAFFEIL